MPVCRNSIGIPERVKTVRFLEEILVRLVKTLCFIARPINCFPDSGYGAALSQVLYAPWFRYLLGGIVILLGIHQWK